MHSDMDLRLLGSGSDHGACPAVYVCDDTGELIVQGDITDRDGPESPRRVGRLHSLRKDEVREFEEVPVGVA